MNYFKITTYHPRQPSTDQLVLLFTQEHYEVIASYKMTLREVLDRPHTSDNAEVLDRPHTSDTSISQKRSDSAETENELKKMCLAHSLPYEEPTPGETRYERQKRRKKIKYKLTKSVNLKELLKNPHIFR